jgi:glutamate formiminotransferase
MNPVPEQLVECVPNFSEGRRLDCVERIVDCFRHRAGVKLLDYTHDSDHNRMVVTAVGQPEAMKDVLLDAIGKAVELIDLTTHTGVHPRLGAADVIPFIPVKNMTMEEAIALAREVGEQAAKRYGLPIFLYEEAASAPHRQNLADVRKGGFEHLSEKMQQPGWLPDFGPSHPHPTAGASIIGARHFLVAYNINLHSNNLELAKAIARTIRFSSGGFPYCKALGLRLESMGMVQVSINLTNIEHTTLHQVYDKVKEEAARYGVSIANSELIGLMPLQSLVDTTAHYLQLTDFSADRVLEHAIWE